MIKYLYFYAFCVIIGCNGNKVDVNTTNLKSIESIDIEQFKSQILSCKLNNLPKYKGIEVKDTIIESEEGMKWPAVLYKENSKVLFIAESNWENSDLVSRITIVSPTIKFNDISVGAKLGSFKKYINSKIPSNPDGYLFLSLLEDKTVHIELDISNFSYDNPIFYANISLDKIPDSLKIESIVIMNR